MQIAFFSNNYLPITSGVVRSISAFRSALTDLGHNVFVFAQEDDFEDEDPFIFRYPSLPIPASVDIPAAIPISMNIDWLLPHLKLDVIHAHHPVLLGSVAAYKAKKLHLPLVFTFHTQYHEYTHYFPLPQEEVQEFLKDAIYDWLRIYLRRCQHIIVPSESMLQIVLKDYGLESDYTVIPTGIDLAPYQTDTREQFRREHGWGEDPIMISVGRLAKEKNWRLLLESAAQVMQAIPRLRVVILGDGPERRALSSYVRKLGITDRVDFVGTVDFDQVPLFLKAADLFGFASTSETQGLVTLEALAAGLPVVAVDGPGTRDIVRDGVEGLLVEESFEALSTAIERLIGDPELRDRFRQPALQRAKDFEISKVSAQLVEVYQEAVAKKAAGHFARVQD